MFRFLALLMFPLVVLGQEIRPPVVTYQGNHASDSFEIRNMSETTPLTVVALTPKTWTSDKDGNPQFADIDPAKIDLRLSEHGAAHIPPGQTHQFWADIKCLQGPCWVCIFASIAQGRSSQGVLVTVMLPHSIEMMAGTIKRRDIEVTFLDAKTIAIKNLGNGLDRPSVELQTADGRKNFGVPIFPSGIRIVTSDSSISRAVLKFAHFKIDIKQ